MRWYLIGFPWWIIIFIMSCKSYLFIFICIYIFWMQVRYMTEHIICKYLFLFCGLSFYSLMVSFESQHFKFWFSSIYLFFSFITFALGVHSRQLCLPTLPSTRFIVLALTFSSMIHFALTFVRYMVWGMDTTSFFCIRIYGCVSTVC